MGMPFYESIGTTLPFITAHYCVLIRFLNPEGIRFLEESSILFVTVFKMTFE